MLEYFICGEIFVAGLSLAWTHENIAIPLERMKKSNCSLRALLYSGAIILVATWPLWLALIICQCIRILSNARRPH
jgi:hypothetical protein